MATVCIFAIGALGLNLLTGVAGQVSLGHSFFMGVGAYTAVWLGAPEGPLLGMGLPIWIWLPRQAGTRDHRRDRRSDRRPGPRPLPGDRDPRVGVHRRVRLPQLAIADRRITGGAVVPANSTCGCGRRRPR
jgi:hypothetical protein